MKKFGLFIIGVIAGIIALANLGSLLGLAISALIVYAGVSQYVKSVTTGPKILWASIALIGLLSAAANVPAFFAVLAIAAIYFVVKKWKEEPIVLEATKTDDPFMNFEKQWNELSK
ncbi:hypothetical protein ACFOZY_10325 [Chungangia koreensis]|uniref:Lia operon protein LiaI n=1 Tax=Chungangia koreensis TaxID=752657 RepID=A0ABV8X9I9_9LACT